MAARLFTLPMPEGGAEHEVCWMTRHGCDQGRALNRVLDEATDEVQFPVGNVGYGMPANVPFEVVTSDICHACGKHLRAWFQWSGPRFWTPAA